MNTVRDIVSALCTGMVIAGALAMLLPQGGMRKPMQMLLSLFTLTLLCGPFLKGASISYEFPFDLSPGAAQTSAQLQETYSRQLLEAGQTSVEELIRTTLSAKGIEAESIAVDMDILEDGSISISKAKLAVRESDAWEAKNCIEQQLGIQTEIVYGTSTEIESREAE